ncbi:hypothetical protein HK414_13000 [Ramlibacter terrae]|uniref:Uncharacterized protein n=1 Tax=Ramlibacter terrae TaxID=2732511 RepID=A0ABX6P2R0_9BURK|nr:hypothetical protein HK414_13000 [Ramlibacter terrae]
MIRLNVHRESWQFPELMERWGFTRDTDVKRLIQRGELTPYATFARDLHPVAMVDGAPMVEAELLPVHGDLWLVQGLAMKVDNFDYFYRFMSSVPNWSEGAEGQLWALPETTSSDDVLLTFVVSDDNRLAVEKAHLDKQPSQKSQNVKDRLLVTLALDRLNWKAGKDVDFTGLTEVIDGTGAYGIPVSYNSAKKHIRDLVETLGVADLSRTATAEVSLPP